MDRSRSARPSLARRGGSPPDPPLAQEAWDEALTILQPRGNVVEATESMRGLAGIAMARDDVATALARYEEAAVLLRRAGNYASLVFALRNVAAVLLVMGEPERSRALIDEALTISERSGNRTRLAQTHISVGLLEHVVGNLPAARRAFERSLAICEELRDPRLVYGTRGHAGQLHLAADELDVARDGLERTIAGKDAEGRKRATVPDRRRLALVAIEQGRLDDAARLVDEAMVEAKREEAPVEIALPRGRASRAALRPPCRSTLRPGRDPRAGSAAFPRALASARCGSPPPAARRRGTLAPRTPGSSTARRRAAGAGSAGSG